MSEEIKRTYTIPLRVKFANTPRHKRANKAVRVLKEYLAKHMKSDDVKIGPKLNEIIWVDGIKNPPGKVKVDVTKDAQGVVRAELTGIKYVDFKPQEKKEKASGLKGKIQDKLEGGSKKQPVKKEKKEDKKATAKIKADIKEAEKKVEAKTETKKETPKAEEKPKVKEEVKPKAEEKPKAE